MKATYKVLNKAFNLGLPWNIWPVFNRDRKGNVFSDITEYSNWTGDLTKLGTAQNHPILTPALLFVSKLFSQGSFYIERDSTDKRFPNHPILELLKNPNHHQTLPDFLESIEFTKIANGVGVVWAKRNFLTRRITSLYVLDYSLIKFPQSMNKGNFISPGAAKKYLKQEILYDPTGENLEIELGELMFFYDLPNAMHRNPYIARSRIDGLDQTLKNTKDSFIAKNIILKSNGKEIISGVKDGFPIGAEEKKEIEELYNDKYGVSFTRKRGIVVSASLTHKSLHIALRDLGLDESVKVDGNLIYTALHIPKDILSLEAKKTTYNNFKESMVSYIQNEMQPSLDSFMAVFNKFIIDEGVTLKGDYEHLPIMQFILIERYKGVDQRMVALANARKAGLPDEIALELVGLDTTIKLNDLVVAEENGNGENQEAVNEQKIRDIIQMELQE